MKPQDLNWQLEKEVARWSGKRYEDLLRQLPSNYSSILNGTLYSVEVSLQLSPDYAQVEISLEDGAASTAFRVYREGRLVRGACA